MKTTLSLLTSNLNWQSRAYSQDMLSSVNPFSNYDLTIAEEPKCMHQYKGIFRTRRRLLV